MGKASRDKGKRGERMLAAALSVYGYDCRRTQQFCGRGGESSDVKGLPGIHIECKFVERLNLRSAVEQAVGDAKPGALPAVFHKQSRKGWLVTMPLEHWMSIYQHYRNKEE